MKPNTCSTCGAELGAEDPHALCPRCQLHTALGAETVRREGPPRCTKCGSALAETMRFCGQCGAPAGSSAVDGDPIRAALEAKLGDQYRIIRLLGRGGMGAVYLARDLILEREVAVKVVRTGSNVEETYERFRREAKTAARLSHPNIVPLHTFGEVEGMPYFVMGYVRGESLAARLHREGRIPEEEGLRILGDVADALDHAHRQGVVHRDVKPDNVMIEDASGRALLTDFGVARAFGRGETLTSFGAVVGTPQYMSPEQASGGGDVDGRSDIYSFGVMAYAVLTGRVPFEGSTAADVLTRHLTQVPPALRSLNPEVSDTTAQAIERCLAKSPSKRWPDARSLRLVLDTSDDGHLPDALQAVEGRGIPALTLALALLAVTSLSSFIWGDGSDAPGVFLVGVIGSALIYLFFLFLSSREGFTVAQLQAAIWREPAWWIWWYPRSWRRRGNVWDRLPREIRTLRSILPALLALPSVFVPVFAILPFETDRPMEIFTLAYIATAIFLWFRLSVRARRRLRRQGLEVEEVNRVIHSVPPSRVSFWSRPHIAPILVPAGIAEPGRADSPHAHLQSILRHAEDLSGPLRPLGAEAAAAARLLLSSIEDADREIAELARNLEAGEEERIRVKIAALEGEDAAPLRSLLEKELELVRGLSERMEEAKEIRNRRMEMLRSLGLHLASLRARSTESPETGSVTDRVRALCDEIAAQAVTQRS